MGRAAILELCESYRNDMRTVKQATHFKALHFHGIQNDEGALYDPDRVTKDPGLAVHKLQVASEYDFTYVNEVIFQANGYSPFTTATNARIRIRQAI